MTLAAEIDKGGAEIQGRLGGGPGGLPEGKLREVNRKVREEERRTVEETTGP